MRPVHRHRQGPGGRHRRHLPLVSRARQPGQPGRPLPARPGHRLGRPGRPAVRPDHRQLRGALGGAQGQCRLCAARRRLPDRAGALHSQRRRRQVGGVAVGLPRQARRVRGPPDPARHRRARDFRQAQDPPDRRREGAAGRSARLPHLHLGHHRQPEGRGDRAPQHLQFRAGGGRALRLPSRRPGLPGHDHRVRLLGRGAVGAADRRRHLGARQARRQPGGRRPRRLSAPAQGHRPVLRADLAGDDREGPAGPAHPAGLGRGLPAQPDGPLASAGPHHPQCLWADRGHRHGDPDRAASRTSRSPSAGRCRPTRS